MFAVFAALAVALAPQIQDVAPQAQHAAPQAQYAVPPAAFVAPQNIASPSTAPQSAAKRVLVYTLSAGYEHDVVHRPQPNEPSLVERVLAGRAKASGWFEVVLSRDANDFT